MIINKGVKQGITQILKVARA